MIILNYSFGFLDFQHDTNDRGRTVKWQALLASRCDVVAGLYISGRRATCSLQEWSKPQPIICVLLLMHHWCLLKCV